jgi:single-stranded DNA-specific DHH superfamily exonuclease
MKTKKQVFDKICSFLDIKNKQKIAIIADNDEDGITAAVNMTVFLKDKGHKTINIFFDRHLVKEEFAIKIRDFRPDKTIFLDLGVDFVNAALEDIADFTNPFVSIDHHQDLAGYKNSKFDYLQIYPKDFSKIEPSKYPVSKMIYDLFGGKDWIALIGVIGDSSVSQWDDFLKVLEKKYSLSFEQFNEIMGIIIAIRTQNRGMRDELFNYLLFIDSPKKIFLTEFYKFKLEFDKKIDLIKNDYQKNAERFSELDLIFYFAKENIINPLINPLSKEFPSTTFVVYKKIGGLVNVSLRRGDYKINLPELIKYSIKDIPNSNGGGHIPAGGASFPTDYLDLFKEKVISYLKQNYNS